MEQPTWLDAPSPTGASQLPLDAEEFLATELLLEGALQEEGPAVAGGVAIVGEQCHQQEQHIDEEALASRKQRHAVRGLLSA